MKLAVLVIGVLIICSQSCETANGSAMKEGVVDTVYSCLPCGSSCDDSTYTTKGACIHCHMELVKRSSIVHKSMEPENLCTLNTNETIFLDVRSKEEFNGTAEEKFGAIKNAVNIPVQELQMRLKELEQYKDKKIVVYCSHSHRSPRASYMLTQAGFKEVINMNGGMSVWKERVKDTKCNETLFVKQ
jgi:rhodanese-related sulfurtransferase